jgi:hypothetical protein
VLNGEDAMEKLVNRLDKGLLEQTLKDGRDVHEL